MYDYYNNKEWGMGKGIRQPISQKNIRQWLFIQSSTIFSALITVIIILLYYFNITIINYYLVIIPCKTLTSIRKIFLQ